jgi:transcriptional regulator with PAS, ATPase and Fis domain
MSGGSLEARQVVQGEVRTRRLRQDLEQPQRADPWYQGPSTGLIDHERPDLERDDRRPCWTTDNATSLGELSGISPEMREVFALIRKVANGRASILITGESGTGKEVVARTIHMMGTRAEWPFVPVNCAAIPEGLLESELFGHVRGAFTGAHSSKRGLFQEADRGTLFLDEIGDMKSGLQAKLLHVLQDQEVRPIGGTKSIKVDVRIIAASNKDLRRQIKEGRFRRDLFYRLDVIRIHIPPLRERPEDIPLLAELFVRRHAAGKTYTLTPAAILRLVQCRWRGNARELENAIERTLGLCERPEIQPEDLILTDGQAVPTAGLRETVVGTAVQQRPELREVGDLYIQGGDKLHAARILGISWRTVHRRIARFVAAHEVPCKGENIHEFL